MNKTLENMFNKNIDTYIKHQAEKSSKTSEVKYVLQCLRSHFKKDKWPLNFALYFEMTKIQDMDVFTHILLKNKMTVAINKGKTSLVIVK